LVHEVWLDVHEIEPAGGEARPVLTSLVLLVEGHRAEVDDLHRAMLLEARLDQLALVGTHYALGNGVLDLSKTGLDLAPVRRGAKLSEEVLEHVDGDVESDFE